MKRTVALLTAAASLVIIVVLVLAGRVDNSSNLSEKLKIQGFNSEGICAALMPACGYCPGEESDNNCYVTQAEFDEYKKQYSELKADN